FVDEGLEKLVHLRDGIGPSADRSWIDIVLELLRSCGKCTAEERTKGHGAEEGGFGVFHERSGVWLDSGCTVHVVEAGSRRWGREGGFISDTKYTAGKNGGQKTDDGRRRTEDRRQRTEDGELRIEHSSPRRGFVLRSRYSFALGPLPFFRPLSSVLI